MGGKPRSPLISIGARVRKSPYFDATLVVSLPIILVGILMSVSLLKQLKKDHG